MQEEHHPPALPADTAATADPAHGENADAWQRLPPRARTLFVSTGLLMALPAALAARVGLAVAHVPWPWALTALVAVLAALFGAWLGLRRYRYTHWRLDAQGFSLRRGRLWETDVRVPVNRVQHLDLRRGPLERRHGLATLVIHTAGTREAAVHVGGLAWADAEHLREVLAAQGVHDHA